MGRRLECGCEPDANGFGWCGECRRRLREKIWRGLSEGQREYDRTFAPRESAELDSATREPYQGCSCHINPPCGYCISKNSDEENDE